MLAFIAIIFNAHAQSLEDGYYKAYFNSHSDKSFKLKITGDKFVKYYADNDSVVGTLERIGVNRIYFYTSDLDTNNVDGPLKQMYRSWGLPIVVEFEKNKSSKNRKYFRTTFEMNYHITVNTGYFERLGKR